MTSAMTQPLQRRRKFQTNYGLELEHKKIKDTCIEGTSPDMIRGGGCAIRPAPTQKWAASTYPAIGTTKKELRRDTTTTNRSHKPQIYTTISPGGVVLRTPGDKSMVCQKRPKLSPGCRILWGGDFLCTGDILCQLRYPVPQG